MFTREFTKAGRTTRFVVTRVALGWNVREERDNTVVKNTHYEDWHRVERAVQTFELLGGFPTPDPRPA